MLFKFLHNELDIPAFSGSYIKTHGSESHGQVKHKRNRKSNDATTTREDFTGTNVVQIRPACNPPSTNAITLKL